MDPIFTIVKRVVLGVAFLATLLVVSSAWVNIPQGQVGVVFDKHKGGVLPQTLGQGWHFRTPLVQWVQEYPVSLRTYSAIGIGEGEDKESNALDLPTSEGQHIQQDISIVYNVTPSSASFVFDRFQGAEIESIEATFIRRMVTSVANNVTGKYSIMDIYGPQKTAVQQEIITQLRPEMERWGFQLDRVNLGAAKFPKAIESSLQAKIGAQQAAETAKFALLQAETDAKSRIAKAEGEAKANELIQASLTPKLVNLRWIEKWNGVLPATSLGSAVPMISLSSNN